ncbi:MAG: hypothetical protein ABI868_02245 [Acidobacteriota bacterium]
MSFVHVRLKRDLTHLLCAALIALGYCAAPGPGWSAQGGKAEALRIRLERGRSSATVFGVLRGDAQREYVLQARRGQSLTIQLTATPPRSLRLTARGSDGAELPLRAETRVRWSATLPEDGDYELAVARVGPARGSSRYRVTVTLH